MIQCDLRNLCGNEFIREAFGRAEVDQANRASLFPNEFGPTEIMQAAVLRHRVRKLSWNFDTCVIS